MDMIPKNPWPQVVLALGLALILVTGSVINTAMGGGAETILALAGLVAGPALAWFAANSSQKLDQVKEISNGNMSRMQRQQEELNAKIVAMNEQLLGLLAQTHPSISVAPGTSASTAEWRHPAEQP